MKDFIKRISSRKFIMAVIAGFVVFGNYYFELDLDVAEVLATISPFLTFIVVEGTKDVVVEAKK